MMNEKTSFWRKPGVQTLLVSLLCIFLGLIAGFIAFLIIDPTNAFEGILSVIKNFLNAPDPVTQRENLGLTLVKTAPLLMCGLSVLFAYKAGLFNIGAAGQYVVGAGACLYCALALHLPWYVSFLAAILAGVIWGALSGALKAFFNVNEVISSIMLNWIGLYLVNILLGQVKDARSPYTIKITNYQTIGSYLYNRLPSGIKTPGIVASTDAGITEKLPSLGLDGIFGGNSAYVTIAIPAAILIAVLIWFILQKTKLGYELKATGYNRTAARYCGMREKKNLTLTMAIAGGLAGCGAAMLYLTAFNEWQTTQSSVPGMGFNGIAAAFLGGLNPIGTIFSSYFIQHITDGGASKLTTLGYPSQVCDMISSLIIYLCGFVMFFKTILSGKGQKKHKPAKKDKKPEEAAKIPDEPEKKEEKQV